MDNYIINIINDHTVLVTNELYYSTVYYYVSQTLNEDQLIKELLLNYKLNFNTNNNFKIYRKVGAWNGIIH